jgi:hypothetical protein
LYNNINADVGSWIKDNWRQDRSLGFVWQVDEMTGMMLVQYPKIGKTGWIVHKNDGHYTVINK